MFTELRLKQQLQRLEGDQEQAQSPDRVVVQQLSSLERDLLREALQIVKEFKQSLAQRYRFE